MQLRPYQHESIHGGSGYAGILACLATSGSTLIEKATGTGKTVVFSWVAEWLARQNRRTLILAPRRELVDQAVRTLLQWDSLRGYVGVEMEERRARKGSRVIVASTDTMRGRYSSYATDHFGLIVIDEAHRGVTGSYSQILGRFGGAHRLGVTATPDRLDRIPLRKVFASLAYRYPLHRAIDEGYLVPLDPRLIMDESLDLSRVREQNGDFNLGELAHVMERKPNLDLVAKAAFTLSEDRPTMIFAASVRQARGITKRINALRPGSAISTDGDDRQRDRKVKAFAAGKYQYLVSCELFIEGFDCPAVSCIAIARQTQSRRIYSQMIGRGTRTLGADIEESRANGKWDLRILDFVGVTQLSSLATPNEVLGWWSEDAEDWLAEDEGPSEPEPEEGLDGEVEQIVYRGEDVRSEKFDPKTARQEMRRVTYQQHQASDPFAVLGVPRKRHLYDYRPARAHQLETLAFNGIPGARLQLSRTQAGKAIPSEGIGYEQAQLLIKALNKRAAERLCPLSTARVLRQAGLNENCSFEAGSRAMQTLRSNGFRITAELRNDPELKPHADSVCI